MTTIVIPGILTNTLYELVKKYEKYNNTEVDSDIILYSPSSFNKDLKKELNKDLNKDLNFLN